MTSFQLPSSVFPDNAITRAERSYQAHSTKKQRLWRRWMSRTVMWLAIALALIEFFGLLVASLTQRDPLPLTQSLIPLPNLLLLFAFSYHFYLMFQTISLTGNSITREKEAQTWEMLVLTGIDARQIVRGKWWASIQRQLPRYLRLSVLRLGATAVIAASFTSVYYYSNKNYSLQFQLPHPITILVVGVLGLALTVANLALSAACGVMGSAVSKRSAFAIVRGFANQIVISLVPVLVVGFFISRVYTVSVGPAFRSIYSTFGMAIVSLVDNGLSMLSFPMSVEYQYYTGANVQAVSPILPVTFDWMIAGVLALVFYALLIWFALWRAENRAIRALASPVS